jgi:hypothetical protein
MGGKHMKKWQLSRVMAVLCVLVLGMLILIPTALAFESREGSLVVIGADEVVDDDLFVGAETFVLDGRVRGDLFVAGSEIIINGVVEGDIWAGGQRIVVNGTLQDDAWLAGYAIELTPDARVGDDLRSAGYSLHNREGSQVGGTFLFGGYQALLAGFVGEDAQIGCFGLKIDGAIEGNVKASVGPGEQGMAWNPSVYSPDLPTVPLVRGGLALGAEARIGGDLDYTATERIETPAGVVAGRTTFTYDAPRESAEVDVSPGAVFAGMLVTWIVGTVRRLAALLLVGALVAWLAPRWIRAPAERFKAQPWSSLGWGALIFFAFPPAVLAALILLALVVAVLLLVTLGNLGGPIGWIGAAVILIIIVLYVLIVSYLTKLIAGYVVGRLLFPKEEWAGKPILPTLVGVLFVVVVTRIPVIGWLLSFAISLFGLGAIGLVLAEKWRKKA